MNENNNLLKIINFLSGTVSHKTETKNGYFSFWLTDDTGKIMVSILLCYDFMKNNNTRLKKI